MASNCSFALYGPTIARSSRPPGRQATGRGSRDSRICSDAFPAPDRVPPNPKRKIMRRIRNAKIIATLGPASSSEEVIRKLFVAGVDMFRLNFSHGTQAEHKERFDTVWRIGREFNRPIGILGDLQGPKLRVGKFAPGGITLVPGATFRLDLNPTEGDANRVNLPHPEIFAALVHGATLLLDDGKLELRVEEFGRDFALTRVVVGGHLTDRKGVNVPSLLLPISPLTEKDRRDLQYALELGVDWIALSFVQRPEDIFEARAIIGDKALVMTKLEKPAAIDRLDEIVRASDSVMVARGDLGVELPPERVPVLQRAIVRACRREGKPVIIATQMLESMTASPVPTRAEASDVASAMFQGADAVMLSAESAAGKYPVEAVTIIDRNLGADARGGLGRCQCHVSRSRCGDVVRRVRGRQVSGRGRYHDGPHHRSGGGRPLLPGIARSQPRTGAFNGR